MLRLNFRRASSAPQGGRDECHPSYTAQHQAMVGKCGMLEGAAPRAALPMLQHSPAELQSRRQKLHRGDKSPQ